MSGLAAEPNSARILTGSASIISASIPAQGDGGMATVEAAPRTVIMVPGVKDVVDTDGVAQNTPGAWGSMGAGMAQMAGPLGPLAIKVKDWVVDVGILFGGINGKNVV